MLIRTNPWSLYRTSFRLGADGLLWVTSRWIVATGRNARVWAH